MEIQAPLTAVFAIVQTIEYDDYGNATKVSDANNNDTDIDYDDVYNLYPVTMENALGHTQSLRYIHLNATRNDGPPGVLREARDANGLWNYYFYDDFGRLIKSFRGWYEQCESCGTDDDEVFLRPSEAYHYADGSIPLRITSWRKTQNDAIQYTNGGVWERTFYDGFGNPIQTQTAHTDWSGNAVSGENSGQRRIVDTVYNAAGSAISQSEPYLVAAYGGSGSYYVTPSTTANKVTSAYDPAGRTVQTIGLDGAVNSVVYGNRSLYAQDGNHHIKASFFDAVGQLVAVDETVDLGMFTDDFEDGDLAGWQVRNNVAVVNDDTKVARLIGILPDISANWAELLHTIPATSDSHGNAVAFSFRVTNANAFAQLGLQHGAWDTSNYRLWGLVVKDGSLQLQEWQGNGNSGNETKTPLMPVKANTWYRVLLRTSKTNTQSFSIVIWERDNPAVFAERRLIKNDGEWLAGTWQFFARARQNWTLYFDNYDELKVNRTYYKYDPVGNLTHVTNALGHITQMIYDAAGRKRYMNDPDMGQWYYAYDNAGNLESQTDAKVQTIDFEYDDLNRLTAKRQEIGGAFLATYEYDATADGNKGIGRRTGMTAYYPAGVPHNEADWRYDILGRVMEETRQVLGNTYTFGFGYTQGDVPVTVTYPGGSSGQVGEQVTTNYYWQTGQPKTHVGDSNYVQQAQYNRADGQITRLNMPTTSIYTTFAYDSDSLRLNEIRTYSSSNTRFRYGYSYDLVGNIDAIRDYVPPGGGSNQWQYFTYDSLNRLTHAYTSGGNSGHYDENYEYNALGNLVEKAGVEYEYNGGKPHAVTDLDGDQRYWYDLNGNMTRRIDNQNRDWTLGWTAENMLHTATNNQNDTLRFVYDADGLMILRVVDEGQPSAQSTVHLGKIFEHNVTLNSYRKQYLFGGRLVAVREGLSPGSGVSYFATDALGSVTTTLYANGTIRAQKRYRPFGEERYSQHTTPTGHRYTGQRWDADLGLYDYNARYYDAAIGRFISADSIVPTTQHTALTVDFHILANGNSGSGPKVSQSLNRYTYAFNNPINGIDPTGHDTVLLSGDVSSTQADDMIAGLEEAGEILEQIEYLISLGMFDAIWEALIGVWNMIDEIVGVLTGGAITAYAGQIVGIVKSVFKNLSYEAIAGTVAGFATSLTGAGGASELAIGLLAPIVVYLAIATAIAVPGVWATLKMHVDESLGQFKAIQTDLISAKNAAGANPIHVEVSKGFLSHYVTFSTVDSAGRARTYQTRLPTTPLQVLSLGLMNNVSPAEAILAAWSNIM